MSSFKAKVIGQSLNPLNKEGKASWENYDSKKHKYAVVKASKGGGSRKMTYSADVNEEELLKSCIDIFWKNRKKSEFKDEHFYNFKLADCKKNVITSTFSVGEYCDTQKMVRPRIYFLTQLKTTTQLLDISSDDSDFDLPEVFETPRDTSKIMTSTPNQRSTLSSPSISTLMGTSTERNELRREIDQNYQQSLHADIAKDQEREMELARERELELVREREKEIRDARLSNLMNARRLRVEPEPNLDEGNVVISVRHIILGNKSRLFSLEATMTQVYDWVGGMHHEPEYFKLFDYGSVVLPDQMVFSCALNMAECDSPLMMSVEGNVAFQGFAVNSSNETTNDASMHVHAEQTNQSIVKVLDTSSDFDSLESLRKSAQTLLVNETNQEISRDNIYEDFLLIYEDSSVCSKNISFKFKDEEAVGDGVTRDAFSAFFVETYKKFEGNSVRIPLTTIELKHLELIGKIITHAFITHGIFPVEICKASLMYVIYGEIDDGILLNSFLGFIPMREAMLIESFAEGKNGNVQAVMDILNEYRVFTTPTKENIYDLCKKAANICLIRSPCFCMQKLYTGMGSFWKDVSKNMFLSLFESLSLTSEKVIKCLQPNELKQCDGKITTWLQRYIRSCTEKELANFCRFVTGKATLLSSECIKVEYVNQPIDYLRPQSATCFKILMLPRQYLSFSNMTDNLNFHLNSGSWEVHDA